MSKGTYGSAISMCCATALLSGCASQALLISSESDLSNADAIRKAQEAVAQAEVKGCYAKSIAGGVAFASGLVIGEACIECLPQPNLQNKRTYVVDVLMACPSRN